MIKICDQYAKHQGKIKDTYYPLVSRDAKNVGFKMPKEIKNDQVIPLLPGLDDSLNSLPADSILIGLFLFYKVINNTKYVYPQYICVEVNDDSYIKFEFRNFSIISDMGVPFVKYDAVAVLNREEASKYKIYTGEK